MRLSEGQPVLDETDRVARGELYPFAARMAQGGFGRPVIGDGDVIRVGAVKLTLRMDLPPNSTRTEPG